MSGRLKQLHEAGITDITIAVGYLKEKFEYLIDKHQVKLLYNPEYATQEYPDYHLPRTLQVLAGKNMYILSSDNWLRNNMFHAYECGAWYASSYMEGDDLNGVFPIIKGTHHPCGSGRA